MHRAALPARNAIATFLIAASAFFSLLALTAKSSGVRSNPPELRAENHTLSLTLHAATRSDRKDSFYFNGQPNAPTLRLSPGDQLKITYVNELPTHPQETCAITPCMDMTNLHFHGLAVSPDAPQDDVLSMMATPASHSTTPCKFPKIILPVCIGITPTLMERAIDKSSTACPARSSSKESSPIIHLSSACPNAS